MDSSFWPALGYGEQEEITTLDQWLALQEPQSRADLKFAVYHCHKTRSSQPVSHQIRLADGSHVHAASFCRAGSREEGANIDEVVGCTISLPLLPKDYQGHMLTAVLGNVQLPLWLQDNNELVWVSELLQNNQLNPVSGINGSACGYGGRMPLLAPCNPLVPEQKMGIMLDVEKLQAGKQELLDSLADARSKSEERTIFLAAMSHEIRTPTSSILGFVDLLLEDGLTEAQEEFAQIIRRAGEELSTIVDSVLDFTRLESGEITPSRRALDLRQMITDACREAKVKSKREQVSVTVSISSSVPVPFVSDPSIIAKIMTTLISNALRHAELGIFVRVFPGGDNDNQHVVFAVGDQGSEDDFTNLVVPFSKRNEEACLRKGAGLDLAIVRRLVERLKGRVLTGKGGSGVVLVVELPIELDEDRDFDPI